MLSILANTALVIAAQATTPASSSAARPSPVLATIFADHAVIQRDRPITVWGRSDRQQVTVSIGGRTVVTRPAGGRWQATLPALPAGGPYVLTASDGAATRTVADVMIGDVYLCGGQSNMEFPARQATGAWGGLVHAPDPMLRFAKIERDSAPSPVDDLKTPANWRIVDADSVGDESAVCYFMARSLQRDEKVPVGFIDSDWGGTTIQSWISPTALATLPAYREGERSLALLARDPAAARANEAKRSEAWWRTNDPRWAETRRWSDPSFDDAGWSTIVPAGSWKGGNHPDLAGFDGVVWLRQEITLTAAQAAGARRLALGPIATNDTVWINGRWIGSNGIDWFWRDYAIPAGALHEGRNVIALRVLGDGGPTGQPGNRQIQLADGGVVPLAPAWRYRVAAPLKGVTAPGSPWEVPASLSTLYNGMIAPIERYGFKLAAWYQGESNVGEWQEYRTLLPMLIADWRSHLGDPALPFLVAQLASYGKPSAQPVESGWAALRDIQAKAVRADPHAGLAVTLDLGDRYDIHPTQKMQVGERLARAARSLAYGAPVLAGGPEVATVTRAGDDLIVAFRRTGGGLRAYSSDQAIGFEACAGARCRYVPGTIDGDHVILRGGASGGADKVRYAWSDAPYVNLYGAEDLPAVPFEWPVR